MLNGLAYSSQHRDQGPLDHDHPVSWALIKVYQDVRFGQIEGLKIQDGLPMPAEEVTKKTRFFEDES